MPLYICKYWFTSLVNKWSKLYPGFISLGLNFSHWWTLTLKAFELSWPSFKVFRISLQFCFLYWRCNLGVILTLIDLSSSVFESLAPRWSVWQPPCFSSSGYQKKHSWDHSDLSATTRETSKVYIVVNCDFTLPNLSLEGIRDTAVHTIVRPQYQSLQLGYWRYSSTTQSFPYRLSEIK